MSTMLSQILWRRCTQVLCGPDTVVLIAHGRNRPAEAAFLEAVRLAGFSVEEVCESELHETYRCLDVSVLRLQLIASE